MFWVKYRKKGLPHMILLDNSLRHDNKLLLEVLSHELGHYFTTVGNFIKGNIYSDNLQIKLKIKLINGLVNF